MGGKSILLLLPIINSPQDKYILVYHIVRVEDVIEEKESQRYQVYEFSHTVGPSFILSVPFYFQK